MPSSARDPAESQKPLIRTRTIGLLKTLHDALAQHRVILDQQHRSIAGGHAEKYQEQTEAERAAARRWITLRRVAEECLKLFHQHWPEGAADVAMLEEMTIRLTDDVQTAIDRNRNLIKARMSHLKDDMVTLRRAFGRPSPYGNTQDPGMVDLST